MKQHEIFHNKTKTKVDKENLRVKFEINFKR